MKVLTSGQMKELEQASVRKGLSALQMMENAGTFAARCIANLEWLCPYSKVVVFCGPGSNGGDGYVIARNLHNLGCVVQVFSTVELRNLKGEAAINARIFLEVIEDQPSSFVVLDEEFVQSSEFEDICEDSDVMIDCLYGTGFRGKLKGLDRSLVRRVREMEAGPRMIAVDVPSGIDVDSGEVCSEEDCFPVDLTLALQFFKPCHVLYPNAIACGVSLALDVGILEDVCQLNAAKLELIDVAMLEYLANALDMTSSSKFSHKGQKGSVVAIGGSTGMSGAPQLCAEAALSAGAGVVSMLLPSTVAKLISHKQRELMCFGISDTGEGDFSGEEDAKLEEVLKGKKAIAIGPGLSTSYGSKILFEDVLEYSFANKIPTVIDAGGLSILNEERALFELLGDHVVLTPHPGEMARFFSCSAEDIDRDRLGYAKRLAEETSCVVVLKGPYSLIADPDGNVRVCSVAVSALATAGSGDVLTGVIAAVLARGVLSTFDAVSFAVCCHAGSGFFCSENNEGRISTKASDLIKKLPVMMGAVSRLNSSAQRPAFMRAGDLMLEIMEREECAE